MILSYIFDEQDMKNKIGLFIAVLMCAGMISLRIISAADSAAAREEIIKTAREYLGTAYRYGDTGTRGFDCSGFTMHVFGRHGIALARTTTGQFENGTEVAIDRAMPGDLVFFKIRRNRISHVGIYLGDHSFIHSPSSGKRVQESSLDAPYWKTRFAGAVSYFRDASMEDTRAAQEQKIEDSTDQK
jgi:cell wall-associated NlpC family hydrolase